MQNPRLASRYAKSLLDLSIEQNSLDATLVDMKKLKAICDASSEFELMLRSPIIKGDRKLGILKAVLANQSMSAITMAFITLLVQKGREQNLPEMADAFVAQYNELKHIKTVRLTTATQVTPAVIDGIKNKVAAYMPGNTLNMETNVDESLIGGFVLEIGDKLVDASVKKSLNDIRTKITDHSYESKLY
jgi:F-type H+-transporting ATPase subunit delta